MGYSPWGCKGSDTNEPLTLSFLLYLSNVYPSLSVQFSSVAQSCLTLCDPMNRSTPQLSSVYLLGFPGNSDGKESAHNAGDLGSILW